MNGSKLSLAKKYARAWKLHIGDHPHSIEHLDAWAKVLLDRTLIRYLRLDMISSEKKRTILEQSALSHTVEISLLAPLFDLLQKHGRMWLIGEVIQAFVDLYYHEHEIMDIEVSTVDKLSIQDQEVIERWIQRQFKTQKVRIHSKIDSSLIAGIRIQGAHSIWEYSVKSQLSLLKKCVEVPNGN